MQTKSVTQCIGLGYYFPGKVLQTLFTGILCCIVAPLIFRENNVISVPFYGVITGIGFVVFLCGKIVVAFRRKMLYNTGS